MWIHAVCSALLVLLALQVTASYAVVVALRDRLPTLGVLGYAKATGATLQQVLQVGALSFAQAGGYDTLILNASMVANLRMRQDASAIATHFTALSVSGSWAAVQLRSVSFFNVSNATVASPGAALLVMGINRVYLQGVTCDRSAGPCITVRPTAGTCQIAADSFQASGIQGTGLLVDGRNCTSLTASVAQSSFANCSASGLSVAADLAADTSLMVSGSTFSDNVAAVGGGILAVGLRSLQVWNCAFNHNRASATGGAVQLQGFDVADFTSCRLVNNSVSGTGGAIAVLPPASGSSDSNLALAATTLMGNTAPGKGAELFFSGSTGSLALLAGTRIEGRTASCVIAAQALTRLVLSGPGSGVVGNSPSPGNPDGPVCITDQLGELRVMDGAELSNNSAGVGAQWSPGGAVLTGALGAVLINNGTVKGNTAKQGGAIYARQGISGQVMIANGSVVEGNTARDFSGGFLASDGPVQVGLCCSSA
jgi:predicted outer membrane repeat protein